MKSTPFFLRGGSAFGLNAAAGIMQYLEEQGVGFDTGAAMVPVVPGAILFDLHIGKADVRPDAAMGYQGAKSAKVAPPAEGNAGCGAGATVGKFLGLENAMKGGLGVYALKVGELLVGSLVAVNCFGEVIDPATTQLIGGAYHRDSNSFTRVREAMAEVQSHQFPTNTTIGAVLTNARLTKTEANKVAQMAHSGISRTITPAHAMLDGDALFTLASGRVNADVSLVGDMAALAVERAIVRGITKAATAHDYLAYRDIFTG